MATPPIHPLILAGGSGTRFWPRSRRALPKQFLRIGTSRTLLRETYERLLPLAGPQGVSVATGAELGELVRRELPELRPEGLLLEPAARDTAAAIGVAAEWLSSCGARDEELILVCPSDHLIGPPERFQEAVRRAAGIAASGRELVTFGIPPRSPSSAFGYVERGAPLSGEGPIPAYRVRRFVEKPDRARAEEYLRAGGHYWNAGIFVFSLGAIRGAIGRHFPELRSGIEPVARLLRAGAGLERALEEGFPRLEKQSIDRGVLEKAALAGEVAVVEAGFDWDDVGSWNALGPYLKEDGEGNRVEGRHVGLDTRGCIIAGSGRRLIGTVGLRDLVVVETDDAILVCRRDQVEKVKELVERMRSRGEGEVT
jgi:mannose-1-phosphate guanylyltransferase